jgi:hypothetical protein
MSTTTRTTTRVRTEVYVGEKIAYAMQVILAELGLGAASRRKNWDSVESAMHVWLGEQSLNCVSLEVFSASSDELLGRFDVDIDYSVGEPSMRHDAELSRLAARKVALKASGGLEFRILMWTASWATSIDGWNPTTARDTSALRKRMIGELARGPGIGSELSYRI